MTATFANDTFQQSQAMAIVAAPAKPIPLWKEPKIMVCLVGSLDGLDFGRLRFHRVSADHGADSRRVTPASASGGVRADDHIVDAARRCRRRRLAR